MCTLIYFFSAFFLSLLHFFDVPLVLLFLLHLGLELFFNSVHGGLHLLLPEFGHLLDFSPAVSFGFVHYFFDFLLCAFKQRSKPTILSKQLCSVRSNASRLKMTAGELLLQRGAKIQCVPLGRSGQMAVGQQEELKGLQIV